MASTVSLSSVPHPPPPAPRRSRRREHLGLAVEPLRPGDLGGVAQSAGNGTYVLLAVQRGHGRISVAETALEAEDGLVVVLEPGPLVDLERFRPDAAVAVAFRPEHAGPRSGEDRRQVPFPGDARWAARHSGGAAPCSFVLTPRERPLWETSLDLLSWELEQQQRGFAVAARAHLTTLLIGVSRLAFSSQEEAPARVEDALEAIAVIDARFTDPLSLEDVARAVGRSPRHLSRLVREITGETVMYWIDERRMAEARRLLVETDDTVEQIAVRTGYRDPGYFRRRFRRSHTLPPSEWRAALRGTGHGPDDPGLLSSLVLPS